MPDEITITEAEAIECIGTLIEEERHRASQSAENARRAAIYALTKTEKEKWTKEFVRWSAVEARMTRLRHDVSDVLRSVAK